MNQSIDALAASLPEPKAEYYTRQFPEVRERFMRFDLRKTYHVGAEVVEATFLFLLSKTNDDGDNAYPCKVTIANAIGIKVPKDKRPKPVQRALRVLEHLGELQPTGRMPNSRAGRYRTIYSFPQFQSWMSARNSSRTPEYINRYVLDDVVKNTTQQQGRIRHNISGVPTIAYPVFKPKFEPFDFSPEVKTKIEARRASGEWRNLPGVIGPDHDWKAAYASMAARNGPPPDPKV